MSLYDLPKFKLPKIKKPKIDWQKILKEHPFSFIGIVVFLALIAGFLAGVVSGGFFYLEMKDYLGKLDLELPEKVVEKEKLIEKEYLPQTTEEMKVIKAVEEVSPAVVSIIVSKDLPIIEEYYKNPFEEFKEFFSQPFEFQIPQYRQKGVEKKEIGGGTGFIVSEDGMILTNKHVVLDEEADYTVLTNDGRSFPARVLARDSIQDLAVIKIDASLEIDKEGRINKGPFTMVKLGDSSELQIGQTVIAIGNALGEFRNTVSVGVISGLGRRVTASGGGIVEIIEDVIQTDAAINRGNSGGPLLNLKGEVIGINTAMALEAENIGFAIPINKAKRDIEQVRKTGKIVYPFLGIRYILINKKVQEEKNLPVDYGILIISGDSPDEKAIFPGSAAEKIGLREKDIILEFNGQKITTENTLGKIIQQYNPGDKITLKVLRDKKEIIFQAVLGERE